MGNLGFFECECILFVLFNAPAMVQKINEELPRGTEHNAMINLFG